MTVKSLLENMTQAELCHWIAFHKLEQEKSAQQSNGNVAFSQDTQEEKDNAMVNTLNAMAANWD